MKIPFNRPSFTRKELKAVNKVLKSGHLVMGKKVEEFEQKFAQYCGAKYGIMVNGCTSALFLSLKYLNLQPGDEVIVPSLTFAATAESVVNAGGTPVFCDVDPLTWTLDWEKVKHLINGKTRAVVPVHLMGNDATVPNEMKVSFLHEKNIKIIYDSAHKIDKGFFDGWDSCYSFYATKNLTTGIGGMILTNNKDFYEWASTARRHGITAGAHLGRLPWKYSVDFVGWNMVSTDINAAIGLEQLKKMNILDDKRRKIINRFNWEWDRNHKGLHLYPVLVENREAFFEFMQKYGIQVSAHFQPLHKMPAYAHYNHGNMDVTDFIGAHTMSLPLFPDMKKKEIQYVIDAVNTYYEYFEHEPFKIKKSFHLL